MGTVKSSSLGSANATVEKKLGTSSSTKEEETVGYSNDLCISLAQFYCKQYAFITFPLGKEDE